MANDYLKKFAPVATHLSSPTSATKSATNGLMQRSKKKPLLDNLVGAQLEFAAYREPKRVCSLEIDD